METNMEIVAVITASILDDIAGEKAGQVTGNQKIRVDQIARGKLGLLAKPRGITDTSTRSNAIGASVKGIIILCPPMQAMTKG